MAIFHINAPRLFQEPPLIKRQWTPRRDRGNLSVAISPRFDSGARKSPQGDADMTQSAYANTAEAVPARLHHYNYTCQDPEKTRAFYEGLLGIKLTAFWCEVEPSPVDGGKEVIMGHSFYALGDGSMLAFMHHPDRE